MKVKTESTCRTREEAKAGRRDKPHYYTRPLARRFLEIMPPDASFGMRLGHSQLIEIFEARIDWSTWGYSLRMSCNKQNKREDNTMCLAKTTEIIFEDESGYFSAMLDNGGVRIGLKDCQWFDFPEGHKEHGRVLAASLVGEVEILHDEFMCAYAYGW